MIPQDYLSAVTEKYPCPAESGYERAYWLFQFQNALIWISGFIEEEYRRQIAEIQETGMTADRFELIPTVRQESRVILAKMREKYPVQYAELVHIKASDAAKILGKKNLYVLAKEKAGDETIARIEQVNVGDVERTMLAEEAAEIIETRKIITGWTVSEKEP